MNKTKSSIGAAIFVVGSVLASPSAALAASNFESCSAMAGSSYLCVGFSGYTGTDPYNVSRFSTIAQDGTRHSCTSYAAFRLFYNNSYNPAISNFDSAQYWASQAVANAGATLSLIPQVGDVAWWAATPTLSQGHVAIVDAITYTSSGAIFAIQTSDDNAGRQVTTRKTLYPGVNAGTIKYPDKFIRFPGYLAGGGGGGRPPIAQIGTLSGTGTN